MEWGLMECTTMPYDDASFDVVLDKSLLDCACLHYAGGSAV